MIERITHLLFKDLNMNYLNLDKNYGEILEAT